MARNSFGRAWEQRDAAGMVNAFAADGVLHSPVGDGGFTGSAAIADLVQVVIESTSDTLITREWSEAGSHLMAFQSKFHKTLVHGIMELELDDTDHIRHLWMYVRPLTAVVAVADAVGTGVIGLRSPALGRTAELMIKPMVAMAALTNMLGNRTYDWINRTAHTTS